MRESADTGAAPAELLQRFLPQLLQAAQAGETLDLAAGQGQNGLLLAERGAQVLFIDRNQQSLDHCARRGRLFGDRVRCRQVDLEQPGSAPLANQQYAVILVFRYLHRPLMPAIQRALKPGGLLVYETFTTENRQFGRPRRDEFLLQPGELNRWFADWEILHHAELVEQQPVARAVAQLVARKPRDDH
ncbi:MAG: methyltransferase domain-containing protein [Gammaproteobacteria bacterium]